MEQQLDLFDGRHLRDIGIQQAKDTADAKIDSWSDIAYDFLLTYAIKNKEFMAEEVRMASVDSVPVPPSNRAWGSIFVRAVKNGIIKRNGFKSVSNPRAHRTPATLWVVVAV